MKKATKPAGGKNDGKYRKCLGQKAPEVYESTLINNVSY